jgi:hypothetical protein
LTANCNREVMEINSANNNQICYVILSDLHLGEENSILNEKDDGSLKKSQVMMHLAKCLKILLKEEAPNKDEDKPILILNGDILDLALGKIGDSSMIFDEFMKEIMSRGEEIFNHEIIFIPGNHDHHIWEIARETQYKEDIYNNKNLSNFPEPRHNTGMIPGAHLRECDFFLTSVIKRHLTEREKELHLHYQGKKNPLKKNVKKGPIFSNKLAIRISYPNYIIPSKDFKKFAILHHGHFTERSYYLVSYLNNLFTNADFPKDIDALERENFAWIDFMWSTLGRSGAAGTTVKKVWEVINNPGKLNDFLNDVSKNLGDRTDGRSSISKLLNPIKNQQIRNFFCLASPFLDLILKEINHKDGLNINGLSQFLQLSWPKAKKELQDKFKNELQYDLENEIPPLAFIYGHTHQPFDGMVNLEIEKSKDNKIVQVSVHNSGGWIVDHKKPIQSFGASIVLMNSSLDIVSLQIYKENCIEFEALNKKLLCANDSTFESAICNKIKKSQDCWNKLTECANIACIKNMS